MPPLPEDGSLSFSLLEYAPDYIVHAPFIPYWFWLWGKYGGATLPSIANPSILTGGIAGESKTDLFALVGPAARAYFAPFITVRADAPMAEIRAKLSAAKLSYPLVAKPDQGKNGRGMKIVHDEHALAKHLAVFPGYVRMLLQRYIAEKGEAGVFYVRKPSEKNGRITSLTLKYFPSVVGDGRSTLRELILRDSRARKISHIYFRRNAHDLDQVMRAGEERALVSVGNHVRGALFINGAEHITPAMTAVFDTISKDIKGFHFGRFDVRFADLEDLKRGEKFSILEFNGASSEPTHVWDPRMSALEVWRDLLYHWRLAFEIGAEHKAQGAIPDSLAKILAINRAEDELVATYPDTE